MRLSPYSEETRRRAAAEALARKASGQRFFLRDVAAEVGVRPATIRNWVAQFGPGDDGLPTPDFARGDRRPVVHVLARVVSRITVGSTPRELMLRWRSAGIDRRASLATNAGGRPLDREPASAAWPTA